MLLEVALSLNRYKFILLYLMWKKILKNKCPLEFFRNQLLGYTCMNTTSTWGGKWHLQSYFTQLHLMKDVWFSQWKKLGYYFLQTVSVRKNLSSKSMAFQRNKFASLRLRRVSWCNATWAEAKTCCLWIKLHCMAPELQPIVHGLYRN